MSDKINTYKVTYTGKINPKSKPQIMFKLVKAISLLDAEKNADLYPPLIIKIEKV